MGTRMLTAAVFALAAAFATLGGPDPAWAMGVGVYGTLGAGTADWRDSSWGSEDYDDQRDTRHGGAGLVIDTTAPFSPLGYRLSIGWERITHDRRFDLSRLELEGVVVDQDLTVQLIGGPGPLRMWAGPELRLAFLDGSVDNVDGNEDFLAIGLGPVFGIDFDVSPSMAISWKLGYLFSSYSGRGRSSSIEDSSLDGGHAYASLAILFSPWGDYGRHAPPHPQRGYEPQPQRGYEPQPGPSPQPGYNPRRW